MLKLDHIVLAAETLQEGVDYVQDRLGVSLDAGGQHDLFGTHNRLLGLGDCYFEVIARIPLSIPAQRPLWFDLEHFAGPPRVITWLCQTREMGQTLSALPYDPGQVITVTRDDLIWDLTVAEDGRLAMGGAAPSLIDWKTTIPPTHRLREVGCRLKQFKVYHPQAGQLRAWADHMLKDPRIGFETSEMPMMSLTISTPNGDADL
jgi:hypothetical protein